MEARKLKLVVSNRPEEVERVRVVNKPWESPDYKSSAERHASGASKIGYFLCALMVVFAAGEMYSTNHPRFSEKTRTIYAPTDDINDSEKFIEGINTVNNDLVIEHIEHDPRNQTVLADGLQAGEKLVIPAEVEATIFGVKF